jgi:hypothetical protein
MDLDMNVGVQTNVKPQRVETLPGMECFSSIWQLAYRSWNKSIGAGTSQFGNIHFPRLPGKKA